MTHEKTTEPEPPFPTPKGSLERTVDEDETPFANGLDREQGEAPAESDDDDQPRQLERFMIRFGGNGF
jgi:hypothetical protein